MLERSPLSEAVDGFLGVAEPLDVTCQYFENAVLSIGVWVEDRICEIIAQDEK
jgi:hypothetical protein